MIKTLRRLELPAFLQPIESETAIVTEKSSKVVSETPEEERTPQICSWG